MKSLVTNIKVEMKNEDLLMQMASLIRQVQHKKSRFIVVSGGVCSSLGKGVLTGSIGILLKQAGLSINVIKCDPYLNVDPGTMSPLVHGEVFVTNDGAEADLDLGHYERMLDINLTRESSITAGQIFKEVLAEERKGVYLGRDIQLVPHVVNVIKRRILLFALKQNSEVILIELGGTVGDMEGNIFLEAIRQLHHELGHERMINCHLSYVPYLSWAKEFKTKPTQQSIMLLQKKGLCCDLLFLRLENYVDKTIIEKLSLMCGLPQDSIFQIPTCDPIYSLFLLLNEQSLYAKIKEKLGLKKKAIAVTDWKNFASFMIKKRHPTIKIGMVAKYIGSNEPYLSVVEAVKAAAWQEKREVECIMIDAEALEKNSNELQQKDYSGIIIPGGFDKRGTEGMIKAISYTREHNIPCLGLCLGLQIMLIEFARNLLGLKDASSLEFDPKTKNPVIVLLDEQMNISQRGGTMRLGVYPCLIKPQSKAYHAYGKTMINERHRHRYEFNNAYKESLERVGVVFSGIYPEKKFIEIAELSDHPFMIGTQFHPEFLSRPLKPHPLFHAFIQASM